MKTRKLISALLSALLLCSAAVVLFSAADTAAVQKSREENSAKGSFFFDLCGSWDPNDRISFYVWAKKDNKGTRYFYNGGWKENDTWSSKKTYGIPVEGKDGLIESYEIEFVDGWEYGVIFCDVSTGAQTKNDFAITKDIIGKTVYLYDEKISAPHDGVRNDYIATFDKPDDDNEEDYVTYYFLAPDEFFKKNDKIGAYYWEPEEKAKWPGIEMTPAPLVGDNVFQCSVPKKEKTAHIIFNSFFEAPASSENITYDDYQTVDIYLDGYVEGDSKIYDTLENFYDMIYVLAPPDLSYAELRNTLTRKGEWFSIFPGDYNYYKNYKDYYGTYGLEPYYPDTPDTPETPETPNIPDTPDIPRTPDTPFKTHELPLGDVDGDGKVSAKDSMAIQRFSVNLKKLDEDQLKAADVDGDGNVTNKDALYILRYTIKIKVDYPIGMVTYYFLAPDSYLEYNDQVGVYYWQPREPAPWLGAEMTPAPEVGKNVYKCSVPNKESTWTIIFNSFVDVDIPIDPELVKVSPQTQNISVEGYVPGESEIYETLDNFYGMIYVINLKDDTYLSRSEFTGFILNIGEWFSINPDDYNYYRNYKNYYGTYGLDE